MAIGDGSGPQGLDVNSMMLQNALARGNGGGGGALFAVLPDVQIASFSFQGLSPFKDASAAINYGNPRGFGAKFFEAVQRAKQEMKDCAAQAGVMYSGELPSGSTVRSGLSGPSGSGYEIS